GEEAAAVVAEFRRDRDQPGARKSAERAGDAPAEQEREDGADRVERDDAEPHSGHADAEDPADRPQQDVEARPLRGEDLPPERLPVAEGVEAEQVNAFVEGRT